MLRILLRLCRMSLFSTIICVVSYPALGEPEGVYLYKYKDAQGSVYISHQIPPENYQYGYTALDQSGRVIEVVPPVLTPEQREKELQQIALEKMLQEQAKKDQQLLKIYDSVASAERARDGKMKKMDVMIDITLSKLAGLRDEYDRDVARAAESERMGWEIDKSLLKSLQHLEEEIVSLELEIVQKTEDKDSIYGEYAPIISRLRALSVSAPPPRR